MRSESLKLEDQVMAALAGQECKISQVMADHVIVI